MALEAVLMLLAVGTAVYTINYLAELWGKKNKAPAHLIQANMSHTDIKMALKTQEIIKRNFGGNLTERVMAMDSVERMEAARDFTQSLIREYGLSTQAEFFGDARERSGYYSYEENKIYINVADLLVNDEAVLTERLLEFLDTIIHELRHAVQYEAIHKEGFWDADEAKRLTWAYNMANYIPLKENPSSYAKQPIEEDARTFAAQCLEGVL